MSKDPEAEMFGKEAAIPNTTKCVGRTDKKCSGEEQLNQSPRKEGEQKVGQLKHSYQTRLAALPGLL